MTTAPSSSPLLITPPSDGNGALSSGSICAIVAGVVIVLCGVAVFVVYALNFRARRSRGYEVTIVSSTEVHRTVGGYDSTGTSSNTRSHSPSQASKARPLADL